MSKLIQLDDEINEQYSIYINPNSTEQQKKDARQEIQTLLAEGILGHIFYNEEKYTDKKGKLARLKKKYKKEDDLMDLAGMAIMDAVNIVLTEITTAESSEISFFDRLFLKVEQNMGNQLIKGSMAEKSGGMGFHLSGSKGDSQNDSAELGHYYKMYRRIKKAYEEIRMDYLCDQHSLIEVNAMEDKIVSLIALKLQTTEDNVRNYLKDIKSNTISLDVPVGKEENEDTLGDFLEDPTIRISEKTVEEVLSQVLAAVQTAWDQETAGALKTFYSKEFTYELLEYIDELSCNLEIFPDLSQYPIIDKGILAESMDTSVIFKHPAKKDLAISLGIKTITNEYKRFLAKAKKYLDD